MNRGKLDKKHLMRQKIPENDFRRIFPNTSDIQMHFFGENIKEFDYMLIGCEPKNKEKCLP